jgi:hypothetical protein
LTHATQLANHLPNNVHIGPEAGIDLRTRNIQNTSSLANFFPAVDPWLVNGLNNAARLLSFSEPWLDSRLNEASRLSQFVQEEIGHGAVNVNDLNDAALLGM